MKAKNITQEELDYLKTQLNETNGCLKWNTTGKGRKLSLVAGTILNNYTIIRYTYKSVKKTIYAHRLIWQMYNGLITDEYLQIDHLDRNEQNNDISNLSLGTTTENLLNRNVFGIIEEKYITILKMKYAVNIVLNMKNRKLFNKKLSYVGIFDKLADAIIARDKQLKQLNQII